MQQQDTTAAPGSFDAAEDAAFNAWLFEHFQQLDGNLLQDISSHIEPMVGIADAAGELWQLFGASPPPPEVVLSAAQSAAPPPPAAAAPPAWPSGGGAPPYQQHAVPSTTHLLPQLAPQQVGWMEDIDWVHLLQQQQQQQQQVAASQHGLMVPQLLQQHDGNTAAAAAGPEGAAASTARRSGSGGSAGGSGKARGGKAGGSGARKPRVTTDAQRRAHKRFRVRRKEQMEGMEQEVADKLALVDALTQEQTALQAKARVLEGLLTSAGDSVLMLEQHMQGLALEPSTSGQRQQSQQSSQHGTAAGQVPGGPADAPQAAAASTADAAPGTQRWQGSHAASSSTPAALVVAHEAAVSNAFSEAAAGAAAAAASAGGAPDSPAAALERLESAVLTALGRPHLLLRAGAAQPLDLQLPLAYPQEQQLQLQATLPALRRLLQTLTNEVMSLVVAASQEAGADASSRRAAPPGSAALQRLQSLRQQCHGAFRLFSQTNAIPMRLLYTLNLETGALGVKPPPGHCRSAAAMLQQRLDPVVLQDACMAHTLCSAAQRRVAEHRRALLAQLASVLAANTSRRTGSGSFVTDSLYHNSSRAGSSAAASSFGSGDATSPAHALLNAIDANLRKEHVIEGVFQWFVVNLLPPLVMGELVAHSHPFLPDYHLTLAEIAAGGGGGREEHASQQQQAGSGYQFAMPSVAPPQQAMVVQV